MMAPIFNAVFGWMVGAGFGGGARGLGGRPDRKDGSK